MRKLLLVFALLFGVLAVAPAQNVTYNLSPQVEQIYGLFVRRGLYTKIPGWRVQIVATTDRQQMETVRQQFLLKYPSVPLEMEHTKPYYKIRVGAFDKKSEADKLKETLDSDFPGTYLVRVDLTPMQVLEMYDKSLDAAENGGY